MPKNSPSRSTASREGKLQKSPPARGLVAELPATKWTRQFQPKTLYAEFRRAFRRTPPLFLSEKEFDGAKDEFVAREVGRRLEHLRRSYAPLRPEELSTRLGLDAMAELEQLLWPIHIWQGRAAFAVKNEQYERAKVELKRLEMELKRIAKELVPPKPRFSKLKEDPLQFLRFYAERLFFWTLLHEERKVLGRRRRNPNLIFSELKQRYAYLDLPSDFDEKVGSSPGANAREDVAERFGLKADSIPPLLTRWLGSRKLSRQKRQPR